MIESENKYYTKNGFFWTYRLKPVDEKKGVPYINLEKIFKGKKAGDMFSCKIDIIFSFDDGKEEMLSYNYRVTVMKGEYVSPFYF